jgi:hypothetical protein
VTAAEGDAWSVAGTEELGTEELVLEPGAGDARAVGLGPLVPLGAAAAEPGEDEEPAAVGVEAAEHAETAARATADRHAAPPARDARPSST